MAYKTFQEGDIKAGVRDGGHVRSVFIIARPAERGSGYIPYIRVDWTRGFRPLRTFRDKGDRVYRDLNRLVGLLRVEFAYLGEISLFISGDPELRRFRTLLPTDRDALATEADKEEVLDGDAPEWPEADKP